MGRFKFNLISLILISWLQPSLDVYSAETTPPSITKPLAGRSIKNDVSPALRGIKPIPPKPGEPREIPLRPLPKAKGGKKGAQLGGAGLALQNTPGETNMPVPAQNFEGVPNVDLVLPPDTNGDVGPNHYVQMVNISFAIWDRNGNLLYGPAANNTLWSGFGGVCDTHNDGDPIVLYDQLADRWLMSQFALSAPDDFHQCIAISQTGDPTGAWYRYDFLISATKLNDYPKFGIWPDAYYMAINQFDGNTLNWAGQGVVAFERDKMLVGLPAAQMVYFDLFDDNPNLGGMLPSDLDGLIPPPSGSPNYFIEVDDEAWGWPSDQLQVFEFHVDWTDTANSTFTGPSVIDVAVAGYLFDSDMCVFSRDCIPQPGTAQGLDAISDRLMYRLAYRNFGSHEALVVNHTVDVDGTDHAGIRWYEIRDPGGAPFVFQAGTYAPDSDHRWMGSIAMDANGNMALGFSVSSNTTFPSIRYTGRLEGDPQGTLPQGEATLIAGGGSQTHPLARWGDYSMMAVDPLDDCTFWYTQEYYASTSGLGWQTRIGSFKFPSCTTGPSGTLEGTVTDAATTLPISNAQVVARESTTFTNASGFYRFSILPVGSYDIIASAFGYGPQTAIAVTVTDGGTTVQDFSLASLPIVTVQGTVTDGSEQGWTLYARIDITDYPDSPVYTNPVTGQYSVDLFQDTVYTFMVSVVSGGYNSETRAITPPAGGSTEDFALTVNETTCNAPGYQSMGVLFEPFETGTLPSGWSIIDHLDNGQVWRFDDPGGRGNLTGGNGGFAIVDSDWYRWRGDQDTELISPSVDFSSQASVFLEFDTDFRWFSGSLDEVADVDVSADDGVTWSNVWRKTGANYRGPKHEVVDISGLTAGQADVKVRFHYYDANWEWWWQVDNVSVGNVSCDPLTGGLVVGNVYDADTGNPLNGATVDDGLGNMTATFATPDDPALDDGFYILFSPPGPQTLTASYTGYADEIQMVNVVANSTVMQNFNLLPTYNLFVTKTGVGSGTVTSNPSGINCGSDCSEVYTSGTVVTLTPISASGSTFSGWSGDPDCSDGSVTMDADKTCTATFNALPPPPSPSPTPQTSTLTVTKAGTGSGTVTSSPSGINCGTDCSESYNSGTLVNLTAMPASGSTFAGWSGACSGTGTCSVTMNTSKSVTATFYPQLFTLTVTQAGSGSGTMTSSPAGISCGTDCSETYNSGTVVNLTAIPATGSAFAGWSGDADCTDGSVTMNTSKTCTATFNLEILSSDLDGSGRVDGFDLGALGLAFGSQPDDPRWNPDADLNEDGIVDGEDLAILAANFGKTL